MSKRDFIKSRIASWREAENLLSKIQHRGIRSLDSDELILLGSLYRRISADLAKARSVEPFGDVALYLNRIVSRLHAVIYSNEARTISSLKKYITHDFPVLIRKNSKIIIFSAVIFLLPAILGFHWMQSDPIYLQKYFPQLNDMVRQMEGVLEDGPALLASGSITPEQMPVASSYIMVNNIKVSITAFAAGITFGLLTGYILIMNGVLLGAVAYLYLVRPLDYNLYFAAGILPHGIIELTAIVFSGAAGFLLAKALIMPGNLTRADSLRYHGQEAIRIMYGVALMLIIAGLIEGFITPIRVEGVQDIVDWIKIIFSVVIGILMIIYFTYAGRQKESV